MIDPENVAIERNDYQLQEFMLFCIAVAGKNARNIAQALDRFLYKFNTQGITPFEIIKNLNKNKMLTGAIEYARLGQYKKLTKAFTQVAELDLRTCTLEDLENVHGIGYKTSRFFLTYTRPNQMFAVLDTHLLRYIREELKIEKVPKATPGNIKTYQQLEQIFVNHCKDLGKTVPELDLEIWTKYSTTHKIPTKLR